MPSRNPDDESPDHSVFNEPAFLADQSNQARLVDHDLPCSQCGYNLRGMTVGRSCPECGKSIARTSACTEAHRTAPPTAPAPTTDHERQAEEQARHSVYNELAIFPSKDTACRVIDRDWSCSKCGTNLRGSPADSPCPDCGKVPRELPTPLDKPGYGSWLQEKIGRTPVAVGWLVAAAIAVLGGLWAVIGAIFAGQAGASGVIIFRPIAEEVMKIGLVVAVIETRPFLFSNKAQIVIAAIGSALGFAVIENLMYLNVYVPSPSPGLVTWRWTVCVSLHTGCTIIASLGAIRVWRRTISELRQPSVTAALGPLVVAAVVHSTYNGIAMALQMAGFEF